MAVRAAGRDAEVTRGAAGWTRRLPAPSRPPRGPWASCRRRHPPARERGELRWFEPGELRRYDLEIGALNGGASIGQFEARVSRLATTVSEHSESW